MDDPRYPVGKFKYDGPPSAEQRRAFLGDLVDAPANLRTAVKGLSEAQLDTPYRPEGWTVRQVVHHVPDSHMHSFLRFKYALAEDEPMIKPYDEATWAALPDAKAPVEMSLVLLEALHKRWLELLGRMNESDFERTFRHPELGV